MIVSEIHIAVPQIASPAIGKPIPDPFLAMATNSPKIPNNAPIVLRTNPIRPTIGIQQIANPMIPKIIPERPRLCDPLLLCDTRTETKVADRGMPVDGTNSGCCSV